MKEYDERAAAIVASLGGENAVRESAWLPKLAFAAAAIADADGMPEALRFIAEQAGGEILDAVKDGAREAIIQARG